MFSKNRQVYQTVVNIVVEKFKRNAVTNVNLQMLQDDLNYHLQYTFDDDRIHLQVQFCERKGIELVPCKVLKAILEEV